jgi:hypothetical protein
MYLGEVEIRVVRSTQHSYRSVIKHSNELAVVGEKVRMLVSDNRKICTIFAFPST